MGAGRSIGMHCVVLTWFFIKRENKLLNKSLCLHSIEICWQWQDLADSVSAEELARYLDLKKLDERVYMFEAVSAYDG